MGILIPDVYLLAGRTSPPDWRNFGPHETLVSFVGKRKRTWDVEFSHDLHLSCYVIDDSVQVASLLSFQLRPPLCYRNLRIFPISGSQWTESTGICVEAISAQSVLNIYSTADVPLVGVTWSSLREGCSFLE